MTSRADINRLESANARLVDMAIRDMKTLLAQFTTSSPELMRDMLLELVPMLVREYGDVAAAAAAEWYEEVRPMGGYSAVAAAGAPSEAVEGSVRALAGGLFTDEGTVEALEGAIQRHIWYSSRATVARNVELDPAKPRFARVPSGSETCAWCDMLASRGWVYHSKETAGDPAFNEYHDNDKCSIVPQWDQDAAIIAGYDPDELYDRYLAARAELEADGIEPTSKLLGERLEDMFPDLYPNGPAVPHLLRDPAHGWPAKDLPGVKPKVWRHILYRHGASGVAQTRFEGMSQYELARTVRDVARAPEHIAPYAKDATIMNLYREIDDRVVVVGIAEWQRDGMHVNTAFPPAERGPIMEAWRAWKRKS